jgi:PilZ domain-containing protein
MMNNFEDKRYFPRATVSLEAQIHDSQQKLAIDVVDLTVHGISFKSEQALPVGSRAIIELDGSEKIRNNELTAEILRCDPQSNVTPPQYVLAAKFTEVNDEYLMDSLALVHGKK